MKTFFVVLSLIGAMTVANAQLLTAAAIVIGAKILIGKGLIIGAAKGVAARRLASGGSRGGRGGHGRHGRDAADFNTVLVEENKRDVDDCAKLLICRLNATPVSKLDEDEIAIASAFGQSDVIDVTQPSVLYDVAAHIGRSAGAKQCRTVYPRCLAEVDNIVKEIKKAAYGN